MRAFLVFFLLLAVVFGVTAPLLAERVLAQQGETAESDKKNTIQCLRQPQNPNVVLCPQNQTQSNDEVGVGSESDEWGFGWLIFHALWITALTLLYVIFRKHPDKKSRVRIPAKNASQEEGEEEQDDNKKEGSQEFPKWKVACTALLLLFLGFSLFVLLVSAQWWLMAGELTMLGFIIFSSWPRPIEFWRQFQSLGARAALVTDEKTTFKDVGGLQEVLEELHDVVSLYKDRKDAEFWDIRLPSGMIFVGPPGCGKTLLARALAGEANLKFFAYSAAEIGSSYVRSGSQDIKQIFANARASTPCVVFLDEIDALGRKRGYDTSGEFDHALAELLHEMDGIRRQSGTLVLAATNREDMIDDALLRPGRFDKKIVIPHPDVDGREHILKIHTAKKRLSPDVNLRAMADSTAGFNGAALEQLTNEAAQLARRRFEKEKKKRGVLGTVTGAVKDLVADPERIITAADFEEAKLRVQMGPARKLVMTDEERRVIAYHELGHAVVTAEYGLEILDKVTLMSRNWALGITESHVKENYLPPRRLLLARITTLLGGRAAEEVFLGEDSVTTGAGNDFEKAVELARKMVGEWGMGKLGPAVFHKFETAHPGLRVLSEHMASKIDAEVEEIITECLREAKRIIRERKVAIESLAETLLERLVLHAQEIIATLDADKKRPESNHDDP